MRSVQHVSNLRVLWSVAVPLLLCVLGCERLGIGRNEGSEQAARAYLKSKMEEWMLGKRNEAVSLRTARFAPPIGYEIKNLLATTAYELDVSPELRGGDAFKPEEYAAYKVNVVAQFESEGGTPVKHGITYSLIWCKKQKTWCLQANPYSSFR